MGLLEMSVSVINFLNAKLAIESQKRQAEINSWRPKTEEFARNLNGLVDNYDIDKINQATLLLAKAIDVLAGAGPAIVDINEQHRRAQNLMQSVIRSRLNLNESSIRILSDHKILNKTELEELKH